MKRTAAMDPNLVPNFSSPAQEPMILPLYVHPYSYLQAAGVSQPPLSKRGVAQENNIRKSMSPNEDSGKTGSRWTSHKKETCRCAVCKQVRGELSSTWFNHDKSKCACSVCKQARGEKRSVERKSNKGLKVKTSSISKRMWRLAGMALPPKRNADLTETGISQVSDKLSVTQLANAPSAESSAESSSLNRMFSINQSNMFGAVASTSGGTSSSGSNFGYPNKNVSRITEDSTLGRFSNLRSLFDDIQTAVMESSVNISKLTPSVQSSQPVQPGTSRFSWKTWAPYAESQSDITFQPILQASDISVLQRPGERMDVSKVDNDFALGVECSSTTSVVSHSQFADRTSLTSVSVSDGNSDIPSQVAPKITDPSWTSRLSDPVQPGTSRFSWKTWAPYAESQSDITFQPILQASDISVLQRPGERMDVSKVDNDFASGVECSSTTSVVSHSQFADRTSLTSVSISDGNSDIPCQVAPKITDPSWTSRLSDPEVSLGGSPSFLDDFLPESSSVTTFFSRDQLDMEISSLKWSAGPSISESENPSPRVSNLQISKDSGIYETLISTYLPNALHVIVQEPGLVTSRKKRKKVLCTSDRNTRGCDRCADRTPGLNQSCESHLECIQCTSYRTRKDMLSSRMQITRSLSGRLHDGWPCSHISGLSLNIQVSGSKLESFKRPTRSCRSNNQITPASVFTISFASRSQFMDVILFSSTNGWVKKMVSTTPSVFNKEKNLDEYMKDGLHLQSATQHNNEGIFDSYTIFGKNSEQVLHKLFIGSRVAIFDIYTLLKLLEQAGNILPQNMKLKTLRVGRGRTASGPFNYQQCPHHSQRSLVEVPSQRAADVRTHRSQSALLLGVEPCSFSSPTHYRRNLLPFTSVPNEEFSSDCVLFVLRNWSKFRSVRTSYSGLEASSCLQSRHLHDVQTQIQRRDYMREPVTEERTSVLAMSTLLGLPCVQLGPRSLIDHICSARPNTSCSCLSTCAREGCGFSCTDAAEEKSGSLVEMGVTPEKKSTKRGDKVNAEDITSLPEDDLTVLQRGAGKRKDADQCSDAAVIPLAKRMRTSWRIPPVSTMSSGQSLPFVTAKTLGNFSASAFVCSQNAASQPSKSKSNGEPDTRSQGVFYDEKVSSLEADKPDDDLRRQLEHLSPSKSDRHGAVSASQNLNALMQRKKPPTAHSVRQTARSTVEATIVPARHPALFTGLSFQELLSSVSQNLTLTCRTTGTRGEGISNQTSFSVECKSASSTNLEAQGLQRLIDTSSHSYTYRGVSSCKQLQDLNTIGEDSRFDAKEVTVKDMKLGGDTSNFQNESATNIASTKSKRLEDTNVLERVGVRFAYSADKSTSNIRKDSKQHRCSEEVSSFQGIQEPILVEESIPSYILGRQDHAVRAEESSTLSLLSNLMYRRDKIAALLRESTQAGDLMIPDEQDVVEVEALQSNVLVEQEKTEFQHKLSMLLEKPFDPLELDDLEKCICVRKPQMRLRESRQEVRHVPLSKEGLSYLEHYPEFRRKLESAHASEEKLKLLRGFFFWIQHTCMSGAFMPWEDKEEDDDIQILEEKVVSNRHMTIGKSTRVKGIGRQNKSGVAAERTKDVRPVNVMHMSLRARKKTVYEKTSKPQRAKKNAHQLATTKVKTEGHEDNAFETLRKGNSDVRIVTARRASLTQVERVRKGGKSTRRQHKARKVRP